MIAPIYGVKCLILGFDWYIRYSKIGASIQCSKTRVSFYVEKKMVQGQLKQERQIIIQTYKILQKEGINLG